MYIQWINQTTLNNNITSPPPSPPIIFFCVIKTTYEESIVQRMKVVSKRTLPFRPLTKGKSTNSLKLYMLVQLPILGTGTSKIASQLDQHYTYIIRRASWNRKVYELFTGNQWFWFMDAHAQRTSNIYCFLIADLKPTEQWIQSTLIGYFVQFKTFKWAFNP